MSRLNGVQDEEEISTRSARVARLFAMTRRRWEKEAVDDGVGEGRLLRWRR
jgi:hypothetical protein